jgi:phosphatidylserine decarboxylase
MTLHREGSKIMIFTFIGLLVFNLALTPFLSENPITRGVFGILSLFIRVPIRKIEIRDGLIISPADGKVVVIEKVFEDEYFKEERIQVSIFMSPFNVHINWAPMAGIVKYAKYHPGKFLVAWHPKSSTENERSTFVFENSKGAVLVRQIAGFLARRIVFFVKQDEQIGQGDEFGFIKFGSRVDLLLPINAKIKVELDQKVTGKQTIIAEL